MTSKIKILFFLGLLLTANHNIYSKDIFLDCNWDTSIKSNIPFLTSINNSIIDIKNISNTSYILNIKVVKNSNIVYNTRTFINANGIVSFPLNESDKTSQYKLEITTEEGNVIYGYFYIE